MKEREDCGYNQSVEMLTYRGCSLRVDGDETGSLMWTEMPLPTLRRAVFAMGQICPIFDDQRPNYSQNC